MAHILHLVSRLAGDGPTRALIALVQTQAEVGDSHTNRVVTLDERAYPWALLNAAKAGITVVRAPSNEQLQREIAAADIVQVNFWNHPPLYRLLRGEWPPARVLLRVNVLGLYPPQEITPALVDFADYCAVTSPATLTLPALANFPHKRSILALMDFGRVDNFEPQPHVGFQVGYVGTVNFGKLHSDFVAMCEAIRLPDVRFVVCGNVDDAVQRQVDASPIRQRFDLRGYVEEIGPVLAQMDVFGYPLAEDTYATSEKSLQEAMYVGIPPVVLRHAALVHLVQHNVTGLIVDSTQEYSQAIEYLYHHPAERARLGHNARAHARTHFAPQRAARQFSEVYAHLLQQPKRSRQWRGAPATATPAAHFIDAMGPAAPQFEQSLHATQPQQQRAADALILQSSSLLAGGEGGVMHYRNTFPTDPWLRYWAGLILLGQQRYAAANGEFAAAVAAGLEQERIEFYWNRAAASQTLDDSHSVSSQRTL